MIIDEYGIKHIEIGDKFGKLTVIDKANDYISPKGKHQKRWICHCDCGKDTISHDQSLKNGTSISCGCIRNECIKINMTKHGLSQSRIYAEYRAMIDRCYNKNIKCYSDYGARHIIVCDNWLNKENGFINFYNWSIANGYNDNLTIDRINNNGNYEPSNCRWIPKEHQGANKRNNIKIKFNTEEYTLSQIAKILGVEYYFLHYRLKSNNWDLSSLFTYITNEYGITRAYLLDKYGNPIPINAIYFIDEYGFPISQNSII